MTRCATFVIGLLLAACAPGGPAIIEIGTGTEAFEPLEDGQDIPMILGVQGGWHLWMAVRARSMDPNQVSLEITVRPLETGTPRQSRLLELDLAARDGWYEHAGVAQVLSLPECFQDREVVVEMIATDRAGRTGHDERIVIPRWSSHIGDCDH